jgi:hypothetical protein
MALTRGRIIGYDTERMMFEFTMMAPDGKAITCEISSVTMNQMDHARGARQSEREAQFIRIRDSIEKIASNIFEGDDNVQDGVLSIFEKHLPDGRFRRGRKSQSEQ